MPSTTESPAHLMHFGGRILFLSEQASLVRRQLQGEDLTLTAAGVLRANVSTDEITPAWICYHFDQKLGDYPYLGLRCEDQFPIAAGAVKAGGFMVTVAGARYGKGSSREASPYAEKLAGIRLVIAESFERIYRQNCHNLGILTSTDMGLVERIRRGEGIPRDEFMDGLDPISAEIVRCGGLFSYVRQRINVKLPLHPVHADRPLTYAEKIILKAASTPCEGRAELTPGAGLLVKVDWRYSHEYVTPMSAAFLEAEMGGEYQIMQPETVVCFSDHLTYLDQTMTDERRKMGLLDAAHLMARSQATFCQRHGIKLHGYLDDRVGSEGICHSIMTERYVRPGQIAIGTDSHTPHCGALGALAFGIGASDMAGAWLTGDVRLNLPRVCRVILHGRLAPGIDAKDVVLHLLQLPYVRQGHAVGQIIEYAGEALADLSTDARATLTNMVAEIGGLTGIVVPDAETQRFIRERRGVDVVLEPWMCSDEGADYVHCIHIDCDAIPSMVARPGDPGLGIPLGQLPAPVVVNIAYGGSCTGGKREDLLHYHEVLQWAVKRGLTVASGLRFFLQFGSQDVRAFCSDNGMLETFAAAGVTLVEPGCGACINAGPGVSASPEDVTISAINRNFPGRSGPGQVWLGSPSTVAASAVAGHLCSFAELQLTWAQKVGSRRGAVATPS